MHSFTLNVRRAQTQSEATEEVLSALRQIEHNTGTDLSWDGTMLPVQMYGILQRGFALYVKLHYKDKSQLIPVIGLNVAPCADFFLHLAVVFSDALEAVFNQFTVFYYCMTSHASVINEDLLLYKNGNLTREDLNGTRVELASPYKIATPANSVVYELRISESPTKNVALVLRFSKKINVYCWEAITIIAKITKTQQWEALQYLSDRTGKECFIGNMHECIITPFMNYCELNNILNTNHALLNQVAFKYAKDIILTSSDVECNAITILDNAENYPEAFFFFKSGMSKDFAINRSVCQPGPNEPGRPEPK